MEITLEMFTRKLWIVIPVKDNRPLLIFLPLLSIFQVEYILVKFDHEEKTAKLLLKSSELLPKLQEEEFSNPGYLKYYCLSFLHCALKLLWNLL